MTETAFIEALRSFATHPSARGLADDAAVVTIGRQKLVVTHDMMVEGVHFLFDSAPADVAWKLVAVNLSDLAAKGAKPLGLLMGYGLRGHAAWDKAFCEGLAAACAAFSVPLIGGDTVALPVGSPLALGMTAIGEARGHIVPARSGALPGDALFVTGTIGDGWAGLQLATSDIPPEEQEPFADLLTAYHRPQPALVEGRALSAIVHAMMDISDGLLLDAQRMAEASGVQIAVELSALPLSRSFMQLFNDDREARLSAATGGDDYRLLFAVSPPTVLPVNAFRIGECFEGSGLSLRYEGEIVPPPERLGYLH